MTQSLTKCQLGKTANIPARSVLSAVYCSGDTSDRILLATASDSIWRQVRVPASDVHQFILRSRRGRELVGLLSSVLHFVAGDTALFKILIIGVHAHPLFASSILSCYPHKLDCVLTGRCKRYCHRS